MKQKLAVTLLLIFVLAAASDARRSGSQPIPPTPQHLKDLKCVDIKPNISNINDCPLSGCSKSDEPHPFDTLLNEQKNIPASNKTAQPKDYSYLHNLPNPGNNYVEGGDRQALRDLGEGNMIRVVAYATRVSKGSSETCNCNLTTMADKDNHIVLIDPEGENPDSVSEDESQTAEFTPRVRLTHPTLKWANLNAWIEDADGALLVRVTGLQMFDSHHLFHDPLHRHNNWEIHPVFHLEFCPKGKICTKNSNANWVDLKPFVKPKPKSKPH
ncbi:MAG: hypothetical protein QOH71_1728 [Blastocatellia bacterium]|jgi:hypothetical protein|nr:hypothetical protein [Blastocatellia bacterium]